MKKKLLVLFTIIGIVSLSFTSCSNSASENDYTIYKVETGVISNSTYNSAMDEISYWSEVNYNSIASLRLYLYNNTLSNHEIHNGITIDEIKEFLLSHGLSNHEVSTEISGLKQLGNDIVFFETTLGNDKKIWMYVTE